LSVKITTKNTSKHFLLRDEFKKNYKNKFAAYFCDAAKNPAFMNFVRIILLFPFSLLYGLITAARNTLYDLGIWKSTRFDVPIINVGNISVGGSGKSPMVMYLAQNLLLHQKKMAILSRGYKRKKKGFQFVRPAADPRDYGDEVMMIQNRFPQVLVAVSENRCEGVQQILQKQPDTNVIVLDDAFQHRRIKAGMNILLSDSRKPFWVDFIMPSGYLREGRSAHKRADMLLLTKETIDSDLSYVIEKEKMLRKRFQKAAYLTAIQYKHLQGLNNEIIPLDALKDCKIVLFSGIRHASDLLSFIQEMSKEVIQIRFPNHHWFTQNDLQKIIHSYHSIDHEKKIILTTEKDFNRILNSPLENAFKQLPLYYILTDVVFLHKESELDFNKKIKDYVG
jgi:tetraacyldisaccharide 4'-kinase